MVRVVAGSILLAASDAMLSPQVSWESSKWSKRNISFPQRDLDLDSVKALLEQGSKELDDAGMSGIIYDAEGQEVFRHSAGNFYCLGDKSCPSYASDWSIDTPHPIYSGTKILTAATFLTAAVETRLTSLDEPFSSSLPDLFGAGTHGGEATPRMVMSHTSGFLALSQTFTTTSCFAAATSMEQCVREIAAMPLQHPAGTQFEYSDFSWEVVGLLLERLTNRTIEENFQSIVAGPLGMANSSYQCPGANSSAARSHAAIGLCTTVSDLGRFVQMMLLGGRKPDGTRILAPTVVSQIYSGQTGDAKLFGDEINYTALIPSRCSTGGDGFPGNYTVLDYGFGAAHYVGWRSEAWMHMGSWGVLHFVAPGRYAAVFSTAYPSVQPALDRQLRVLDEFERLNLASTPMCPTMEELEGDFFVKQPAEVPWTKAVVV